MRNRLAQEAEQPRAMAPLDRALFLLPSTIRPEPGKLSIRISASLRMLSHAAPNRGWPRWTPRISTARFMSLIRSIRRGSTARMPRRFAWKACLPAAQANATSSTHNSIGHWQVITVASSVAESHPIAASTASWIEETASAWPRAKAIRSSLISSTSDTRRRKWATALASKSIRCMRGV
jgi:hypothetical protein